LYVHGVVIVVALITYSSDSYKSAIAMIFVIALGLYNVASCHGLLKNFVCLALHQRCTKNDHSVAYFNVCQWYKMHQTHPEICWLYSALPCCTMCDLQLAFIDSKFIHMKYWNNSLDSHYYLYNFIKLSNITHNKNHPRRFENSLRLSFIMV